MADQQHLRALASDTRGVGAVAVPQKGPRPSVTLARAKLTDGDIKGARVTFDQLKTAKEASHELPLIEAMLLEAEGRPEEALACLGRIVSSTSGSAGIVALSHVRIARLATELGREDAAEASAMATLALDPEDIVGLRALTFAQRRRGDRDVWLPTLRRLAAATDAEEADIWNALEAFAHLELWKDVLALIEQREFELDPWRLTPLRVRAFIELGWQRRALKELCNAYEDEYLQADEAVDRLVEWGALALAAMFIDACMSGDPWQAEARTLVMEIAARGCSAVSLRKAPLQFADAIQAINILTPGREPIESEIARAFQVLTHGAGDLLASHDPAGATRMLVAAARLVPPDRSLLEALAGAARCASLTDRYLDTLLRLWTTLGDAAALLATARGVLETSSWPMICRVMTIAAAEAGSLGDNIDAVFLEFRVRACRKVDDYIRVGDVAAALELVIELSRRWSVSDWPDGLLSRLLRATKRRLRSQRAGGEALIATVGPLYLELSPLDVDVCRLLARLRLRQRSLGEARELLGRIVAVNPHVAGDWVALASVQNDLGDVEARDLSIARALIIAPDNHLPPALATARERMALA